MKKMFLDNLPRYVEGQYKGNINWKECVGLYVTFDYKGIKGEVFIKEYDISTGKLLVQYKDNHSYISISNFAKCTLGKLLNTCNGNFKVEIGQTFKDDKRDIVVTGREYRVNKNNTKFKYYKYTCNKCGWTEGWMAESSLITNKVGCSCCNGKTIVPEINSIYAKAPWMVDLGVSEEDAKRYAPRSNKKVTIVCPDCGEIKTMALYSIYREKSIACICKDGATYPERLMMSVLRQLDIEFKTQVSKATFDWIGDRKYDFYLPDYNMIIETHGLQHYEQTRRKGAKTLKEEQENDKYKHDIALENGIDKYIVIDCRFSELEWIKENVLSSNLANLFDLSKIDWSKCEKFALPNLIKEVCDYWKNKEDWQTVTNLTKVFNISEYTIRRYLKKGTEFGWCEYSTKEELIKSCQRQKITKANPIGVYKDGEFLGIFSSSHEIDRNSLSTYGVKLHYAKICDAINKETLYKGFIFKRVKNNK